MNMAQDLKLSSADDGAMIDTGEDDELVVFHAAADDQLSQQYCDDPLSDPLALDDCLNIDMTETMNINLNSSSQEGEIILVDVDRLKKSICTEATDSVAVLSSDHEPEEAYEQTDLLKSVETVEELPSDGSDSGLGSEQSANSIESQPIRTVICKYNFCLLCEIRVSVLQQCEVCAGRFLFGKVYFQKNILVKCRIFCTNLRVLC